MSNIKGSKKLIRNLFFIIAAGLFVAAIFIQPELIIPSVIAFALGEINISEFETFIENNPDDPKVKEYTGKIYSPEKIGKLFESDELPEPLFKAVQPFLDKRFNKGLESWKTNNLQKLIADAVDKSTNMTPEQKELAKLKSQVEKQERQSKIIGYEKTVLSLLTKDSVDPDFSEFLIAGDEANEDTIISRTKKFIKKFNDAVSKAVDVELRRNGRTRPSSGNNHDRTSSGTMNTLIRRSAGME